MSLIYRDIRVSSNLVFSAITEQGLVAGFFTGTTVQLDDVLAGGSLASAGASGFFTGTTVQLDDVLAGGSLANQGAVPDPLCAARTFQVPADAMQAPVQIRAPQAGWVKDVDDTLDYAADFTQVMAQLPNDSIAQINVLADLDLSVIAIAQRSNIVAALVTGGTPGRISTLTCRITTAQQRVIDAALYIQVITR